MCHQGLVILVIMSVAQTVFFCSDVERGVSNRPLLAFLPTQEAERLDPLGPFFKPREQKS